MAERLATSTPPWALSGAHLGVALAVTLTALGALFGETFASLVDVWTQSDTFAHCFVIVPIALFLIWRRREDLRLAPKRPSMAGLGAVLLLSAGWLAATVAAVQIGQQLAAVLLIPAAVVAVLGVEASKRIAFPLAFLVFAVPFGEALIPALMDFTASFTVASLRITGIPVLREGFFFKIPSGDFEVAKACSGIRYLIACSVLGVLYSHLSFRSWRKRAIFVAFSIVAPIVANGVRAYGIVMIAHLSNMQLAVGVDHLIYGWLFFGALVALLFFIGGKFADGPAVLQERPGGAAPLPTRARSGAIFGAAAATIALAALGPTLLTARLDRAPAGARTPAVPGSVPDWEGPRPPHAAWQRPLPDSVVAGGRYVSAAGSVELTAVTFEPGTAEVVGSIRRLVDDARWPVLEIGNARAGGVELVPNELVLRAPKGYAVVWYWYVIGTRPVAGDWTAKATEGWRAIRDGEVHSALVVLSAEADEAANARSALADYLVAAFVSVNSCATGATSGCTSL